jgi:hypothetical protein
MTVKINRFWDRLTTPHSPAPPARPVAHAHCGDTERLDPHTPKGGKPVDLPAQVATKYGLAIDLKTAKALGLTEPPILLARADGDRIGAILLHCICRLMAQSVSAAMSAQPPLKEDQRKPNASLAR